MRAPRLPTAASPEDGRATDVARGRMVEDRRWRRFEWHGFRRPFRWRCERGGAAEEYCSIWRLVAGSMALGATPGGCALKEIESVTAPWWPLRRRSVVVARSRGALRATETHRCLVLVRHGNGGTCGDDGQSSCLDVWLRDGGAPSAHALVTLCAMTACRVI